MKRLLAIAFGVMLAAIPAQAITVVSWNDANQRGGDLNGAGGGDLEYGGFATALLGAGHTILPGIGSLSALTLAGVDAFFWGTGSHALGAGEAVALAAFVNGGGKLIVEGDTQASEAAAAQGALSALGLAGIYTGVTGGGSTANAGTFSANTSLTTVGPFGDLRGLSFGSSLVTTLALGPGVAVGSNGASLSMVEFVIGSGHVLAVGDPYGFGLFMNPGASLYNPNNANAYLNFLAEDTAAVPEPGTLLLLGSGLASLTLRRRRKLS